MGNKTRKHIIDYIDLFNI